MTFNATPQICGIPDFQLVHIDPEEVAHAFQSYLDTGSKLTGVSLEDIKTAVSVVPADPQKATLTDLIGIGMPLFDAVVWLTAGRPAKYPLVQDTSITKDKIPSMHEIARSVFYVYFMLLVQARYPVSARSTEKPKIPNFLRTIMGMDEEQHVYVEKICSFEPQKFDPKWAQYVSFDNFGQETLSRFGLGVAGYRMFKPFALYKVKDGISPELAAAAAFASNLARAPASWNIHPLTRNPNVLTNRGNLNKNLGNLILDVFTDAQIDEMVSSKVLYARPTREVAHRQYLQWVQEDDITGSSRVFRG